MTWSKIVLTVLTAVVFLPPMVSQLRSEPSRRLEGVSLAETQHREVAFENPSADLGLAGLMFEPQGEGPFPGVVVIHGSGTSRRDNGWYLTLVRHLQDNGAAVLLPDKRGSEGSGGDWRNASLEELATDTVAAVNFLSEQDKVPIARVGVIGMSQGGKIAPIVADQSPDVDFVVNVVGGALPMHDALVYEETHNLREMGFLPGVSDALAYPAAWSLIEVRQKGFWDAVGNFDPVPFWRGIDVPALVLYGAEDSNVDSAKSAEILRSLGNPNIEVTVYEGSGHALESPEGQGNAVFRPDVLEDIAAFIKAP